MAAGAAAATAAAEAEVGAAADPAPCAATEAKVESTQAPPPGQARPVDLKGLCDEEKNPHIQWEPEEWAYVNGWDVAEKVKTTVSTP